MTSPRRWGCTATHHRPLDNPIIRAFFLALAIDLFALLHGIVMSRASKLTLAATGLGTAGIVYFVHWAQEADRAVWTRAPSTIQVDTDNERCYRQCTKAWSEIWRSSVCDKNDRPSSRCKNDLRRNISRSKLCTAPRATRIQPGKAQVRVHDNNLGSHSRINLPCGKLGIVEAYLVGCADRDVRMMAAVADDLSQKLRSFAVH